jgi:hypothetical protein
MPVEVAAPAPTKTRRMSRMPDAPTTATEVVLLCVTKTCAFVALSAETGAAGGDRWAGQSPSEELRSCSLLLADGSPLQVRKPHHLLFMLLQNASPIFVFPLTTSLCGTVTNAPCSVAFYKRDFVPHATESSGRAMFNADACADPFCSAVRSVQEQATQPAYIGWADPVAVQSRVPAQSGVLSPLQAAPVDFLPASPKDEEGISPVGSIGSGSLTSFDVRQPAVPPAAGEPFKGPEDTEGGVNHSPRDSIGPQPEGCAILSFLSL